MACTALACEADGQLCQRAYQCERRKIMRINSIAPAAAVRPVSRMKVSYISLPIRTIGYEPISDKPAPAWLIFLTSFALAALVVVANIGR